MMSTIHSATAIARERIGRRCCRKTTGGQYDPPLWRLRGVVRIRPCKLTSPDAKSLLLLVYRRAALECIRWIETSLCQAPLLARRTSGPKTNYLGCRSAEWGRVIASG